MIRTYAPADHAALVDLFARAGQDSPSGELWRHLPSERMVYLDPYIDRCPDTLFLAEVDGELVGYLTGCPDGSLLPSEDDLLTQAITRHRVMLKPRSIPFFARSLVDLGAAKLRGRQVASGEFVNPDFPGHLHINLVPQARGTGVARQLMSAWQDWLAREGIPGCYLQTLVENTRAVRFFERSGFVAHGSTPLVPGVRYEGRPVHQQTMVWRPPEAA
ncbi:acetyltransferase (GNAT) family protein [Mumia flava]|uniref:Acetyltransferase (GNAT) family protein n=1 Tax=Mumia flava TaxID=1348852 RepID=A0A0B2B6S8_9ACTN|nr:GNAT family N-acetyltransferase [Mumia flava]PJJ57700.1 acetyltransferase (GNAT) family protein [Mumia flava]